MLVIVGISGGQTLRVSQSGGFQALHSLISIYISVLFVGDMYVCKGQKAAPGVLLYHSLPRPWNQSLFK